MATSASARHHLFDTLRAQLGDEDAATLMDSLPPGGWDDVATKTDVAGVRAELQTVRAELKTEIGELRSEMRTEFAELRAEMREGFATFVTSDELHEALRLHVDARIGSVMRSWMFSVMGMQAVTIAGVVAAVRL